MGGRERGVGGGYVGLLEVEFGEGTDVADAVDVHGEFPEEVDDAVAAGREGEPEDEGGEDYAENFFDEDGDAEGVEFHEFAFHLGSLEMIRTRGGGTNVVGVEFVFPGGGHVVDVRDDGADGPFGVVDGVLFLEHASADSDDGG